MSDICRYCGCDEEERVYQGSDPDTRTHEWTECAGCGRKK